MKALSLILVFTMFCTYIMSQGLYHETYTWNKEVHNFTDTTSEKVILFEKVVVEYAFVENNFIEYRTYHKVELINTEEQIEYNNRKYINIYNTSDLLLAKARVVKPNGDVIEIEKESIKSSKDEVTGEVSHYFAIDGLEKGCIIDYMYVVQKLPHYSGITRFFQDAYPRKKYEFHLLAPNHLIFDFAVYNDTNHVLSDTAIHDKKHWKLMAYDIPELINEDQSPYNKFRKQVWYKIDQNLANGSKDMTSYGQASQNLYNRMFKVEDKKDLKKIEKFISAIDIKKDANEIETITAVENYIKTNINIIEAVGVAYENIQTIIENGTASPLGITKLFIQVYRNLGIDVQMVVTNDRMEYEFNTNFESYNCLVDYLIYFPKTKSFIASANFLFRYPLIPFEYTDNNGLFIKETNLGDFKTGIGKVKKIPALGYDKSYNNLNIKVAFNNDLTGVDLDIERLSEGYYAVYEQGYYSIINEENKNELVEESLSLLMKNYKHSSYEVINGNVNEVGKKPFIISSKGTNTELIEKASNKYLFKVGELIGPQVEMYSEKERTLPVWDTYKRSFVRNIEIEIPEGYAVKNAEDLNLVVEYVNDDKQVLLFDSKYVLNGNLLTIDINEFYDQLYFEVDEYKFYRDVVNSAADFNKIVLLIEKM